MIQIDEIGVIYAAIPADAPEDFQPEALPGWHVNATAPVPGWEAQQVHPETPRRTFGSIPTTFYTFDSKAEFDAALETADLTYEPVPVPQVLTMRQARLVLLGAGLLDEVESAVAAAPRAVQLEFEYAIEMRRDWPTLIAMAGAMDMTDADLDALFIAGAKL